LTLVLSFERPLDTGIELSSWCWWWGGQVLGVGLARSKRRAKLMAGVRGLEYVNLNLEALVAFANEWRAREQQPQQQQQQQQQQPPQQQQQPADQDPTPAADTPSRKRDRE
jgi:predicted lipid-binding transport protein (Tim44 family)